MPLVHLGAFLTFNISCISSVLDFSLHLHTCVVIYVRVDPTVVSLLKLMVFGASTES